MVIRVIYRDQEAGAISYDSYTGLSAFEYSKAFLGSGIELSPIKMPLAARIYSFPALKHETYKGLPGLIADSLPDDFGNAILNAWMASQGKQPANITPLQRLQYTGKRGMGALEYVPATHLKSLNASQQIEIQSLVDYVYHQIAVACGIKMMPCHLLNEGDRRHFITQRFDRIGNRKLHVQTLSGLAHVDYKQPGSFSYAELFAVARQLKLPTEDAKQLFRRMAFNLIARNHDDHSKNFAFLLNETNQWTLAPAYDLAYSYKPGSKWVNSHWMSLNGKRDDFTRADFYSLEKVSPIFSKKWINQVLDETLEQVSRWESLAKESTVPPLLIKEINQHLRLSL